MADQALTDPTGPLQLFQPYDGWWELRGPSWVQVERPRDWRRWPPRESRPYGARRQHPPATGDER